MSKPRLYRYCAGLCVALTLAGCAAPPAAVVAAGDAEVNYEGLATIPARRVDIAQVRPGTDFANYRGITIAALELAYTNPDRTQQQFSLSQEQKDRLHDLLETALNDELSRLDTLQLTERIGPDVLMLRARVQDIVVTVGEQSLNDGGRGAAFLEASADATVVLELFDSQTNEILARAVDSRSAEGAALRERPGSMRTAFRDAESVVERWASVARIGLNALTGDP